MSLTSRKGLCVHDQFKKIDSVQLLNEKCEDLADKGKCPYKDEQLINVLASNVIQEPLDIEELGKLSS